MFGGPLDKESTFSRIRRLYKTKSAGSRQRLNKWAGRNQDVFVFVTSDAVAEGCLLDTGEIHRVSVHRRFLGSFHSELLSQSSMLESLKRFHE
jgi:hypothetical protein